MDTKLYIVEDDAVLAQVVEMYFNNLDNFTAVSFTSSREALPAIVSSPPDVLILDVMLPGMNGDELVERAREAGVTCPVIVMTGLVTPEEAKNKNYMIGNRLVVGKPVPLDVLKGLVQQVRRYNPGVSTQ